MKLGGGMKQVHVHAELRGTLVHSLAASKFDEFIPSAVNIAGPSLYHINTCLKWDLNLGLSETL